MILIRVTLIPEAQAAGSPAPIALLNRPKAVLRCRKTHSSNTRNATHTSLGTPAVWPLTQPNQASRSAPSILIVRLFDASMVMLVTTPPTARVTMNEGSRSHVCNTPLSAPVAIPRPRPMGKAQNP
ncbi:hypothetical protein D3C87_1396880 [compost metagenome]